MHRKTPSIPPVKITDHTDTDCIGCPDSKICSFHLATGPRMRSQLLICLVIDTGTKSSFLLFRDLAWTFIRIVKSLFPASSYHTETIFRNPFQWKHYSIITSLIFQDHRITLFPYNNLCSIRSRKKSLDQNAILCYPWLHHITR